MHPMLPQMLPLPLLLLPPLSPLPLLAPHEKCVDWGAGMCVVTP